MSELTPIDNGLIEVVREAHLYGFTCKCDFARKKAEYVGMAASLGLITTRVADGIYSMEWRPSVKGLMYLDEMGEDADATD